MEKYQPTPEEMKAAEASLTPAQSEATQHREAVFNRNETMTGKSGALLRQNFELKEGPFEQIYEGQISGHWVKLITKGEYYKFDPDDKGFQVSQLEISATVDGHTMSRTDAVEIWNKYGRNPMSEKRTNKDIEAIQKEQDDFEMKEIRKDLGLKG